MSLIPYLLVSKGETYVKRPQGGSRDFAFALGASVFSLYLVVAGGFRVIMIGRRRAGGRDHAALSGDVRRPMFRH
jgi:hypothetical protein